MRTLTLLVAFLLLAPQASYAFIDVGTFTESLDLMEQELSGDETGLNSLLEDLESAAEESGASDNYLTFKRSGEDITFWDVEKSAWFYSSILSLVELGIVSGKEDNSGKIIGYDPGGNVSRPAALKMSLLSAGVDTDACGTPERKDAREHWAASFVACSEKMDLGLGGRTLNASATRAEVLHYTLKAFEIEAPEGNPPFSDSTSHEYKNDIAYGYALGIISGDKKSDGTPKGTFRPNDSVNRAEVAKIVKLAIEKL
ncbi:S-layer homology domain-containing protein [Candidatus Peribacteria bacterium]|jgi:hypothetical protein|nr:S-layer homology domain-containing protein [Candidatus Peribacteria bacterium]MBT4021576.1 S-layer homology domain-containing protein [Candidatus Peribacteria bacterium]MBT4240736.1 S-layer homology domain-containing protein [Candidatus Peribacteria bacterium]MBT4474290.1 S-layer homology domain-containing protein [Candidatus Peribacteria bacterium]